MLSSISRDGVRPLEKDTYLGKKMWNMQKKAVLIMNLGQR